jgi:surface polysaccharide O-acyltransferase-like enzyme
MTKNLKLFSLFCAIWPLPFFVVLHWALFNQDKRGIFIFLAWIILGVGFSIAGHKLGKADDQSKTRHSLVVGYIAVATVIPTIETVLWLLLWQKHQATKAAIYGTTLILTLLTLALLSKNTVKGIPKSKLFQ